MSQDDDTFRPLTGRQILARIGPLDGTGSGLDADTVRGRAVVADPFRFDISPNFVGPFFGAEIPAAYVFGV